METGDRGKYDPKTGCFQVYHGLYVRWFTNYRLYPAFLVVQSYVIVDFVDLLDDSIANVICDFFSDLIDNFGRIYGLYLVTLFVQAK